MTGQYQPGQGFVSSPRLALAQALMAQGASAAPVRSPLEGIARVLTGAIGGYVGSGVRKDQQDALAEALKALESPDVPETGRAKAAYSAYAAKSPDTPNPFEGIMLNQMVPKEKFVPVKNDKGQTIGQQSTLTGKIEPYKLENVGAGTTAVNPFGEAVAMGGPKLGEGQVFDPKTNSISTVPNFTRSLAEIEGAKAGGKMAGEQPYVQQRAQAQAQGTGQGELATAAPLAAARASGANQGQMAPVQTPAGPMPGAQAVSQAQATGSGTLANQATANAAKLRDDFRSEKPVQQYREVVPIYQSMQEAAKNNTKASDLNLVYGLAKIFDPTSVVREGEQILVRNTASLPDWLVGQINGLNGGASLQPDTRQALLAEASSRVGAYKAQHDAFVDQYTARAQKLGIDPADIITMPGVAPASPAPEKPPIPTTPEELTKLSDDELLKRLGIRK